MRVGWPTKVALGAMIPAIVGMGLFVSVALRQVRAVSAERIETDLLSEVRFLATALTPEELERDDLRSRLLDMANAAGVRITVISATGQVTADTDVEDPTSLENHGSRPEVIQARREGSGSQRRLSRTVGRPLLYAAAMIPGTGIAVRIARDVSLVETELSRSTANFWLVALAVLLISTVISIVLARNLTRPIVELTEAAGRVKSGDLTARVFERGTDELGLLGRAFNTMTDKLKETVEQAEQEAARLTTILETMEEGVVAVDSLERVSFLNGAARRILSLEDTAAYAGSNFYDLIRDPKILAIVRMTADRGEPVDVEIHSEGPPRKLTGINAAPVGEGSRSVILVLRDLSEMRRLERMRSDFVSNVSHELRTPLATIAAATETLQDMDDSPVAGAPGRFLEMISRSVVRLEALLNDILDLSRLESRPETLELEPVELAALTRSACDELKDRAQRAEVDLECVSDGQAVVLGDARTLHRVVDNLVVNAINYTPAGGHIKVSTTTSGGFAELTVTDTGIGIPEESLERIFERFYRVDKARSRSAGGTGLGLAIAKHAVGLHRGTIEVQSEIARGTTFKTRLPLVSQPVGTTVRATKPLPQDDQPS